MPRYALRSLLAILVFLLAGQVVAGSAAPMWSGPPQNLSVTSAATTAISTSWRAPSRTRYAIVGYVLYLNGKRLLSTGVITTYTFSGLTCGTSYTVGVSALDSQQDVSAPATITTSTRPCTTSPTSWTTAAFTWAPSSPTTGVAVQLNGWGSTCSAPPCTYAWSDAADNSALGSGQTAAYAFHDAGTKYVTLTVTNASGQTASIEHDIVVAAGSAPTSAPVAAFSWSPAAPTVGQQVAFDATGSTCASPCSYAWKDAVSGAALGVGVTPALTFLTAGTQQVTLTVTDGSGQSASVEHDVTVNTVAPPPPPSSGTKLTWSPPTCGDATHGCVTLNLSNTGANQTPSLSASNDYIIKLPSVPLQGGLQIRGGHNVAIVGGEIDLTVPCSDASSACHGINISKPTAGEVYIEGVWIHDPQTAITQSTGDGIDVDDTATAPNDIVLQNLRIDGISGCSGGADHADVFQPYAAANANILVDHLTGTTNCQGMQVDPDLAWSRDGTYPKSIQLKNVNINVLPNPYSGNSNRYAYWLTYGTSCNSGPVTLQNTYSDEPSATLSVNSTWPDTDQPSACKSSWSGTSAMLTFPGSPQIGGGIHEGLPVVGDFVPLGGAGTGYTSPGYQ